MLAKLRAVEFIPIDLNGLLTLVASSVVTNAKLLFTYLPTAWIPPHSVSLMASLLILW
jgi:hypothetical protein